MPKIETLKFTTGYSVIRKDYVRFDDGTTVIFTNSDVEKLSKDLKTGEEYDFVWAKECGKYALFGNKGKVTDDLYESEGRDVTNGLIRVKKDGIWGFINLK